MASERLDLALVSRNLADTRSRARQLIEDGHVCVDGIIVRKPAAKVSSSQAVALSGRHHEWASRAALKLVHGLDHFALDPAGLVCLDVGASTGGFTDVLLSRRANRVHAVDVGHGQMVTRLAENPRVRLYERLNVRDLTANMLGEPIDMIVSDVSFISLRLALPAALATAVPGAHLVALVKPQFEVGPARVGKGGIVRIEEDRRAALDGIKAWLGESMGWEILGVTLSPITGGDGNQEYLIAARKPC